MNRKYGIGFLILCFGLSNLNLGWASEIEISPVIVQPYEVSQLNQQMIERDRQNRDEEFAIKQLIEQNDKLAQASLARQQDEGLAKIDQTMLSYRDALLSRDRARIVANGERGWNTRYGDLIALTEDTDAMTVHQDLVNRSGLISEKYQMLTELKDEMAELNAKLTEHQADNLNQKDTTIEGFKKTTQEQQDKIEMLVDRLSQMDQRINHLDELITEKNLQIARLKENVASLQKEAALKDETIKEQADQIAALQNTSLPSGSDVNKVALPPIVINGSENPKQTSPQITPEMLAAKDEIIKEQARQINLLRQQAKRRTASSHHHHSKSKDNSAELLAKNKIIKDQEDQIAVLTAQAQDLASKEELIKSQADQMALASKRFENQSNVYAKAESLIKALRHKVYIQALDLKKKNETIRWLNQVLAVTKDKAKYYKLTSEQDKLSMDQVQSQVQSIKDDFAQHFKDYDQFEEAIVSLKSQVSRLGSQLNEKDQLLDKLQAQLQNKAEGYGQKAQEAALIRQKEKLIKLLRTQMLKIINRENQKSQQDLKTQQDLKIQLQDKEDQIVKMRSDIHAILQAQMDKEILRRKTSAQADDRIRLAKQLIGLQAQEAALLDEKSQLEAGQNARFDKYMLSMEKKIKEVLAQHQMQTIDLQNHMEELNNDLTQKEAQVELLNTTLMKKIAEEKNQTVLAAQIRDLKSQLQEKNDQIAVMQKEIQAGQETKERQDVLNQQLAAAQDKATQLQHLLDGKIAQSEQLSLMLDVYQKKLESKDTVNNGQLAQILSFKNYLAHLKNQIAYLKNAQTRDLNLSMTQQKMMDEKINELQSKINGLQATNVRQLQEITALRDELSLAKQKIEGTPSADEMEYLRTGLQKATSELKQKDEILAQIKTNADEYAKEFKEQTQEFESLKDQLEDAQQEVKQKEEDLKYKDMAMARFKLQTRAGVNALKAQVLNLTKRLDAAEKELTGKTHGESLKAMQDQLEKANEQIKQLKDQLNYFKSSSKNDDLQLKLQQALDKIDQQGRTISVLAEKLEDCAKR